MRKDLRKIPDDIAGPLRKASDHFLRDGRDLKIDEIAQISGVPRATLYYHFSGKDDILAFVVMEKFRRAGRRIAKARQQGGTALERLTALLTAIVEEMGQYPKTWTGVMAGLAGSAKFEGVVFAADELASGPIVELLAEGRDAGEFDLPDSDLPCLASALYGAVTFAGMRAIHRDEDLDPAKIVAGVIVPLVRGLGP